MSLVCVPDSASLPWHALHVRSQHEGVVTQLLQASGVEFFSPTYWSLRNWSDRRKWIESPLYSGYVFARVGPLIRATVASIPGILHLFGGVLEDEIAAIRRIVAAHLPTEPCSMEQYVRGDLVHIAAGPLKGMSGVVIEQRKQMWVAVQIEILGRATAARIDPSWLSREERGTSPHRFPHEGAAV